MSQQAIRPGCRGMGCHMASADGSSISVGGWDAVGSPNTITLRLPPCQIPLIVGAIGSVLPYILRVWLPGDFGEASGQSWLLQRRGCS